MNKSESIVYEFIKVPVWFSFFFVVSLSCVFLWHRPLIIKRSAFVWGTNWIVSCYSLNLFPSHIFKVTCLGINASSNYFRVIFLCALFLILYKVYIYINDTFVMFMFPMNEEWRHTSHPVKSPTTIKSEIIQHILTLWVYKLLLELIFYVCVYYNFKPRHKTKAN